MSEMGDKAVAAIIVAFILAMAFGYWVEKAYPATITHDLTTQASWEGLTIRQPCKLLYGGTIAYDGGSVTIPGATVPCQITVDLYHRYMQPGTGGLRIGALSVEWDADGWQVTADGRILHRHPQPRAWAGKRVKATLSITETGIEVVESGAEPVRVPYHFADVSNMVLWSSVKAVENAPRWLSVGIATADPTPTPTATESPTATATEAPTAIPTPTPVGYPWVWTLTIGPDGPVGRWFRAPTLILPDGTVYQGEVMPLAPWIGAPAQTDGDESIGSVTR